MNIQEIRTIARAHGIKPDKEGKINLVKHIQLEEGDFDCFATADHGECNQNNCTWRKDCFAIATKGLIS